MSLELIVHPSAKRDIAEADTYYAQFDKADAFIGALDQAFMQIAIPGACARSCIPRGGRKVG